ncbi:uncharacterized protein LOC124172502 [Ischnura elegans]|uniref:uncharacterized protein LOC124172502 n=1 Tax=Ischnura elegans TaxID=197161 RepID=UPI001ED88F1D|nr:uncharacterized protein LOC124172502 [Ischnura elegans]
MTTVATATSDFNAARKRVFGGVITDGSIRAPPALHDWNLNALREMFSKLNAGGNDVKNRVTCLRYAGDASDWLLMHGEVPVTMESWSNYNLLRAAELLGDEYFRSRLFDDAIKMYDLTNFYYERKFGWRFIKSRDMRRKRAKLLIVAERFVDVFVEMRRDAMLDDVNSEMEGDVTLSLRFAYGLSLVAMNLRLEAVQYFCHRHLGHADLKNNENMDVLKSTIRLIEEHFKRDKVQFSVHLAQRLLNVFCVRLMRGSCPPEVLAFAARFSSSLLRRRDCMAHYSALKLKATGFHSSLRNHDAHFLASVINCHQASETSFKELVVVHRRLLKALRQGGDFAVDRLRVTTSLFYALHSGPNTILRDTFLKVTSVVTPDDPRYDIFLKMAAEGPADAREERKTCDNVA